MRLIYIAVAWVLGISFARIFPTIESPIWISLLIILVGLFLLIRRHRGRWIALALAVCVAGGARQSLVPRFSEVAVYNGYSVTVTGIIMDEPDIRDDRIKLRLESQSIFVNSADSATSGLVLVEAGQGVKVKYGDRIRATGLLATAATWDTFSYADYLSRQGVFSVMRYAGVEVIGSGYGNPLSAMLLEFKQILRSQIAGLLPEPQAGLLIGILLGDEGGISPELAEDFSRVGASHIIAISGFNMVIVSAIVIRVLSGLFSGNKSLVTFCALVTIAVYSLFVGASPSILRAALMSSLLVISSQLNRKTFLPTSLAFVALLLSLGDPNVLLDIGFQLSFFAVLGLGVFADPLSQRFRRLLSRYLPARAVNIVHSLLNEALIVSLAAQIATLPLVIFYFGRLSLVALPVNLLIIPIQSALLLLGLAAMMIYVFVPALGTLLFWADLVCLSWTISVVRLFASFEFADVFIDLDGRIIQVFYLLLIGGAMLQAARPPLWQRIDSIIKHRMSIITIVATSSIALILMLAMVLSRPDGLLHLWMLDVGHSNALLLQTPSGAQILVDGGRFPSRLLTAIGDRLPFYDREIELLAITHPDEWDIAALNSVLNRYTIRAALYHGQPNHNEIFQQIKKRLAQADVPIVMARAGYTLDFDDGTSIEVLHPQLQPSISEKLNDQMMVLRVSYGDVSFLLTSDLSHSGQRAILDSGISAMATVLQIPQHGSSRAVDADFLKQVQPQVALLQNDIANRRGDPDPDTLAQFDGLPVFRTDELGTIHLSTDGKTLHVGS